MKQPRVEHSAQSHEWSEYVRTDLCLNEIDSNDINFILSTCLDALGVSNVFFECKALGHRRFFRQLSSTRT